MGRRRPRNLWEILRVWAMLLLLHAAPPARAEDAGDDGGDFGLSEVDPDLPAKIRMGSVRMRW